jgi:hypothetical protein
MFCRDWFPNQHEAGRINTAEDGGFMVQFDLGRVRDNVRSANTEDLLDRVTVYRAGMESEAIPIIEAELRQRGVSREEIEEHAEKRRQETTLLPDGTAVPCSFCHRPAVAEGWGWHRLWGLWPVFPRYYHYCAVHRPVLDTPPEAAD